MVIKIFTTNTKKVYFTHGNIILKLLGEKLLLRAVRYLIEHIQHNQVELTINPGMGSMLWDPNELQSAV